MVRPPVGDTPRLEMRGVCKRFGATVALDDVDFAVGAGEVHALVGENGAGKSTLMKILSGALRPDAGRIFLDGQPFVPANPLAARAAGVAMIYQELNLAPHLTVEQNLTLGIERHAAGFIRRSAYRRRIAETMERLNRPDIQPDTPVRRLSSAERQLVEIARALLSDARVLVMDEPTSSLGLADIEQLFRVIARLRGSGVAIVYISHFLEEVQRVAQRYTVLRDGRNVGSGLTADMTLAGLVELMIGRRLDQMFPRVPHAVRAPILHITGLCGRRLPIEVDLTLHRGEILGLAGLVGAGRTELLRCVFGLEAVRTGVVRVASYGGGKQPDAGGRSRPPPPTDAIETPPPLRGRAGRGSAAGGMNPPPTPSLGRKGRLSGALTRWATRATPARRLNQGVGLLSEDRAAEGLALSRTIAENVMLSHLQPFARFGWINLCKLRQATAGWIARLDIRARGPDQRVRDLSGGNQQKAALARLLHHDVDLLLLDEPTRGIDVASKAQIYQLIGELAACGKAVLLVSSYVPELIGICDRIAVMHRGRLVATRPAGEWTEHTVIAVAASGKESFT
jgi:ribose transport system ATP-binding protein